MAPQCIDTELCRLFGALLRMDFKGCQHKEITTTLLLSSFKGGVMILKGAKMQTSFLPLHILHWSGFDESIRGRTLWKASRSCALRIRKSNSRFNSSSQQVNTVSHQRGTIAEVNKLNHSAPTVSRYHNCLTMT